MTCGGPPWFLVAGWGLVLGLSGAGLGRGQVRGEALWLPFLG